MSRNRKEPWSVRRRHNKALARGLLGGTGWAVCLRAGGLVLLCQMGWQLVTQMAAPLRYPDTSAIRPGKALHDLWAFYTQPPSYLPALVVTFLLGLFILAPLSVGFFRYMAQITLGVSPKTSQMFTFYRPPARWLRSFALNLLVELRVLFWLVLFCGPPMAALWVVENIAPGPDAALFAQLILTLMLMIGTMAVGVFSGRYAAAEYFYSVQTTLTAREAIKMSIDKMRGRLWEYFIFTLSFLLWEMGVAATMGLLYMYYGPYRALAQIQFFLDEPDNR